MYKSITGRLIQQKNNLFLLWLAFIVTFYLQTVIQSVKNPLNQGDELKLAGLWLGFAALVVISHVIIQNRWVTLFWLSLLVFIALLAVILSKNVAPALITIELIVLAWAWGDWGLTKFGIPAHEKRVETISYAILLGLILLALITEGLLMIGIFQTSVVWGSVGILAVLQWKRILVLIQSLPQNIKGQWQTFGLNLTIAERLLLILMASSLLLNFMWSLTPEIQFDSLNYHLAVPKFHIQDGQLTDLPYFWHSYFAHMMEAIYTLTLITSGQILAKLIAFTLGILVGLLIYAIGFRYFSKQVALLAITLFYTTPMVNWLTSTTYVDLALTAFFLGSMLAMLRWSDNHKNGWLWISGLLAGGAFGVKLIAAFGLVAVGAILFWLVLKENGVHPRSWLESSKLMGRFMAGFLLVGTPWYMVVYIFTGNPVFPLLNGIFKSPYWPEDNSMMNLAAYGIGKSFMSLISLPLAMTYQTQYFDETLLPGGMGLAILIAVPFCLGLWRTYGSVYGYLVITAAVYSLIWAFSAQYVRYYMPAYAILTLLAAITFWHFLSKKRVLLRSGTIFLSLFLIVQLPLSVSLFWHIPERIPYKVAFGQETSAQFLSRVLRPFDAVSYINHHANPNEDHVLGFNVDDLRFYLDSPLYSFRETRGMSSVVSLPPEDFVEALQLKGITYILINDIGRDSFNLSSYLTSKFSNRYKLMYAGKGSYVFKLNAISPESSSTDVKVNLLKNASFEEVDISSLTNWIPYGTPSVVQDSNLAYNGQVAVQANKDNGLFQYVSIEPGKIYELAHYSRADQPDQQARLQINWLDAEQLFMDATVQVVPAGSEWGQHQIYATSPEQAIFAQIYVSVHEDSQVWFDEFSFSNP